MDADKASMRYLMLPLLLMIWQLAGACSFGTYGLGVGIPLSGSMRYGLEGGTGTTYSDGFSGSRLEAEANPIQLGNETFFNLGVYGYQETMEASRRILIFESKLEADTTGAGAQATLGVNTNKSVKGAKLGLLLNYGMGTTKTDLRTNDVDVASFTGTNSKIGLGLRNMRKWWSIYGFVQSNETTMTEGKDAVTGADSGTEGTYKSLNLVVGFWITL